MGFVSQLGTPDADGYFDGIAKYVSSFYIDFDSLDWIAHFGQVDFRIARRWTMGDHPTEEQIFPETLEQMCRRSLKTFVRNI